MRSAVRNGEVLALLAVTAGIQLISVNYLPALVYLDVMLLAVMYIGWHSAPSRGAGWGIIFGLVQDVVQLLPFIGLNGVTKTLVGFASAYLSRWIFLRGVGPRVFSASTITVLDGMLQWGLLWLLGGVPPVQNWQSMATRVAVTGVVGSLIFSLYERVRFPQKDFTQQSGPGSYL